MPSKPKQPSKSSKSTNSTTVPKSISKSSKTQVSNHPPGSMRSRWKMDAEMKKKSTAKSEQAPIASRWMNDNVGAKMGKGTMKKSKKSKKRKASAKFLAAGNSWRAHVKETMRKNPNMKFGKPLLKLASKTYKKGSTSSQGTVKVATSKYSVQVRPKTKRANAKKTKRAKKHTSRKKSSSFGFLGL
jgi:hypothetical protein